MTVLKIKEEKSDEPDQEPDLPHVENLNDTYNNTDKSDMEVSVDEAKTVEVTESDTKKNVKLADMDDWFDDVLFVGESEIQNDSLTEQEFNNYLANVCFVIILK